MSLCDHLRELVLCCSEDGKLFYANHAAQRWISGPLEGYAFTDLLVPAAAEKGDRFLAAARSACYEDITLTWELTLGTDTDYVIVHFRGYNDDGTLILLGEIEPEQVGQMQRELLELTTELSNAQRQLHRKNRALEKSLDEQRRLLQTIQELSAPIAPIAAGVILLPLVGHIDSHRANKITEEVLQHLSEHHARYVILDITSIAIIDTAVARHLLDTALAIKLLGARPVLVGVSPAIAETIVHLGIDLHGFMLQSNLQHAIDHILRQQDGSY
jgi:anti-anti-sigma factor